MLTLFYAGLGKLADGWISYFYTPESFAKSWRKVLDSAQAAGKLPMSLEIATWSPSE